MGQGGVALYTFFFKSHFVNRQGLKKFDFLVEEGRVDVSTKNSPPLNYPLTPFPTIQGANQADIKNALGH